MELVIKCKDCGSILERTKDIDPKRFEDNKNKPFVTLHLLNQPCIECGGEYAVYIEEEE